MKKTILFIIVFTVTLIGFTKAYIDELIIEANKNSVIAGQTQTAAPTAEPTVELTAEPTIEPIEEPIEEKIKWHKCLCTAYGPSNDGCYVGCKDDLPLTDKLSIAGFLTEELPYGTLVEIRGLGIRRIEDTAGEWTLAKRYADITSGDYQECDTWFDIFLMNESVEEMLDFGMQVFEYRIISKG